MHPLLKYVAHRPFPPSPKPWAGFMRWHHLLFAHWALDPEHVRTAMPAPLRAFLDVRDGKAWVGVIPFTMTGIRARWTPPLPGLSRSPELNVRTYLTIDGKPGVYFFSLDLMNRPGVMMGHVGFSLPYYYARMQANWGNNRMDFTSARVPSPLATYKATYGPTSTETRDPAPGTLEHFVTERYCLYTTDPRGNILRTNIHHVPWPLQRALADITVNEMAAAAGMALPKEAPHLAYAREMEVLVWWPERV